MISSRGFTLLEFVLVIGILALLLAVGIPSFKSLSSSAETNTILNDFLNSLHYARSEAIKRHSTIIICSTSHCNEKHDWQSGWIIKDSKGTVLHQHSALPPGSYSHWGGMGASKNMVQVEPDGFIDGVQESSFRYCASDKSSADWVDAVVINKVGNARIEWNYPLHRCYE